MIAILLNRIYKIFAFVLLVCTIGTCVAPCLGTPSSNEIIANVLQHTIRYKDIAGTPSEITKYMARERNKKLSKEIAEHNIAIYKLQIKIETIIQSHLQKTFGVEITSEEIQRYMTKHGGTNFGQDIKETMTKTLKTMQALTAIYADNITADVAYSKYLDKVMPKSEWYLFKDYFHDQKKASKEIEGLKEYYENLSHLTAQELRESTYEFAKSVLRRHKLQAIILENISGDDPKLRSALMAFKTQSLSKEDYQFLKSKYVDRWKKEYRKDVVVRDKSFDSIFQLLTKDVMLYPPLVNSASSQSKSPSQKNLQSSRDGTPPPISTTVFNVETIENLIANIEEPKSILLLKYGYFAGHKEQPFVTNDGFIWLSGALDKTNVGALRWFLIQSVRGFGAFHAPDVLNDYGRDAYQEIFDNAELAKTPVEQYVVRESIQDMVFSIATTLNTDRFLHEPKLGVLLLKAWQINQQLESILPSNSHLQPIKWGQAIERVNAQDEFTAIVEDALKDTAHPPDFQMLKLAVVVLQDKEPQRAINLLKTAQKILQPDDLYNQKWLYETWAQLITGNDPKDQLAPKVTDKTQLAKLVEMRKDQISYTGHGYADLLKLYWQLGQPDKAADLIKVARQPGISAAEKIDVAKVLLMPPRDLKFDKDAAKQMQAHGVELLQTYLSSTDKHNPNEEIRARYELGRYFIRQDQITEALQALDIGNIKPTSKNSQTAFYYQQILQMKAVLEKKLSDIPGAR